MEVTLKQFIADAETHQPIPKQLTDAYISSMADMTAYVDNVLSSKDEISAIVGNNPLQIMFDNHRHHVHFMGTVFSTGNFELLARIAPWVYRAYAGHGFSYDYFPLELNAWIEAINRFIDNEPTEPVIAVYEWLIRNHETLITLSQKPQEPVPVDERWLETKNAFLKGLLDGDHRSCLHISGDFVTSTADVASFYLQVIQPSMYEVGLLWEKGHVSVAREHLASAIISRVMATISTSGPLPPSPFKGKVLIAASPEELHEIGAWMVSDILEHNGWDVRYLGANTPVEDLIGMVEDYKPQILALSVTMPFNILNACEVIARIRKSPSIEQTKVIVGGRAFNETPDLWKSTGADGFGANIDKAVRLVDEWFRNEQNP